MPDLTGVFALPRQAAHIQKNKRPLFFGAVQVKKNYVSCYLRPVYADPTLLARISDSLKKRMQGKSCFNFTPADPAPPACSISYSFWQLWPWSVQPGWRYYWFMTPVMAST
jgi:hypothetical protein